MLRLSRTISAILVSLAVFVGICFSQPGRDDYEMFETDFDWIEIEDVGDPLVDILDNGFAGPFEIGYDFPFFGEVYEEFWISANGFIGFGPANNYGSFENAELPDEAVPNNIIALYWTNLDPTAFWADGIIYNGVRDQKRVITYQGIGEHNQEGVAPDNTITMQVVLEPDGDVIIQYLEIGEAFNLEIGSVGMENASGEQGLTLRHDGEGVQLQDQSAFMITEHGPGEFLVWDAGRDTPSGDAQEEALEALGHTVTHFRLAQGGELPDDLRDFEAVFVNLGNFGVNGVPYHELTENEGRILAAYLDGGGAVYLEGSDTWSRDRVTDVHHYFSIEGIADGARLEPPVTGLEGTFGEGLEFEEYEVVHNNFVDHLRAINGARNVFTFHEGDEEFVGLVSYGDNVYKTIGCSFEFGGLVDGENGSREELIFRMVEFFRSPPPDFPAPVNLTAEAGDGEITLRWDHPRRREGGMQREILDIQHEIVRLALPKNGRKPDDDERQRIHNLRDRLVEIIEQGNDQPHRDELAGFNIYMDGGLYDFTNAREYTAIELENDRAYEFTVTALYENPDGESDPDGPVTAVPTESIRPEYDQDFEDFNGALIPVPARNAWEWGEPNIQAHSGERAWATLLDREYPDLADFKLNLPVIDLREMERVWLSFFHFMDAEAGWDGGQLQVSVDNGQRWEILHPFGGYPEDNVFALNSPGFTGTLEGWEQVTFDLTDYINQRIRIRFVFKSDDGFVRSGWFIDDLALVIPQLGTVRVIVDDAPNEVRLPGARVNLEGFPVQFTNNNGETVFPDVPAREYHLIVSHPGFITDERDIAVQPDQVLEVQVPLDRWNSRIRANPEELIPDGLNYGEQLQIPIILSNEGVDPTSFKVYLDYFLDLDQNRQNQGHPQPRQLPHRDEPWDLINTFDLTAGSGEQFFIGAHFVRVTNVGPPFYRLVASAGDFNSGDCRFYHFDRDGNYIRNVSQNHFSIAGWGLRDLASDGRYVFGSQDERIYEMDPITGGNRARFTGAPLRVNRALAYIPEEDAFWVGDWDDTWFKIDHDGNILDRNSQHGLTGVTGMAWNPSDPDGAFLYIHNQESEDGGAALYRFNPETRELVRQMTTAEENEGFAGGAFVSYLYDTHNWVLGVLIQQPERDIVKLYELWRHESWLTVEPVWGELAGNNGQQELTVTFDASTAYDTVMTAIIEVIDEVTSESIQILCEVVVEGGAASISGVVTLEGGEGDVSDVEITINHESLVRPDDDGIFAYPRLAPGVYTVRAELFGYEPYEGDPLELAADAREDIEITLQAIQVGSIAAMVTSVYEDALANVEIIAISVDEERSLTSAFTNPAGQCTLAVPVGIYEVSAYLQGWGRASVEDVEVVENEITEVNFVLNDQDRVRSIRTDGYRDDSIDLVWLPPGTGGEDVRMRFHDGVLANGMYLINPEDIIATRFEPEGTFDVVELAIYTLRRNGPLGGANGWPDFGMDNIYLKIFSENPETGMPDEMLFERLMTSRLRNRIIGWDTTTVRDLRFLEGPFYFGWQQDQADAGYDAVGLDDEYDNEGTSFIRFDDEWRRYDQMAGDQMVEAVIWSHFEEREMRLSPQVRRVRSVDDGEVDLADYMSVRLMNPASPGIVLPDAAINWNDIFRNYHRPSRDEVTGYMVYVDGEPALQEMLDAGITEWTHIIGSENENRQYEYSVSVFFPEGEEFIEFESDAVSEVANMPPFSPGDVTIVTQGLNFTVSWQEPLSNEDGSACVDYAGCDIFINDELAATVEAPADSWEGAIQEGGEGWYDFRLVVFDEVPNRSVPVERTAPLGLAVVYDFEVNTPVFEVDPMFQAWSRSSNMRYGPEEAHSGNYAWATYPSAREYGNNADWKISTRDEFLIRSESARLEFFHFMESETGHDGGQVLISANGGDWAVIEPVDNYPDRTVAGLRNTPGYTGQTGGWTLATFELGEYVNALVRFRWRFGSDQSIRNYPGWYIDDVVLWGCSIPEYALAAGTVTDQDENPVENVLVTDGRNSVFTNGEGSYFLQRILPGEAEITFSKPGYQPAGFELQLEPGENLVLSCELVRAAIAVQPEEFDFVLGGNDRLQSALTVSNLTEILLPYWIRVSSVPDNMRDNTRRQARNISGDVERDDPWDIVFDVNILQSTGHRRIMGAEFAGDHFYLTSADRNRGGVVLVLDWQGRHVDTFNQPVEIAGWGLRDLAWDGEFLYGSQGRTIYAFSTAGELAGEQQGAPLTVNRALAYDPVTDGFWAGEWDSPWYLVDRQGEILHEWAQHGLDGVYGFAYFSADADGMYLYVLNAEEDRSTGIYRADPEAGEIERVHEFPGSPTGCFISGAWDADRWVLGAVVGNDAQSLVGFELGERIGWLNVSPITGEIEAGEDENLTVSINVPPDAEADDIYTGEISIHIFDAPVATVPFRAEIIEGYRHFPDPPVGENLHTITIDAATYLGEDLPVGSEIAVFTPRGELAGVLRWTMAPGELLAYAGDNAFRQGEAFRFVVWVEEINEELDPLVEFVEGSRLFRVGGSTTFRLTTSVPEVQVVSLVERWNLISIYIQPFTPAVEDILGEVNDRGNLVIVKDGLGRFWWPAQDYNGLGDWNSLAGYQVNVIEADEFEVGGGRIPEDTPIRMNRGWNIVAYLLDDVVDSRVALENVLDDIIIAKNGYGRFMVPELNYYGLGDMSPGEGFKIKAAREVDLVYNRGDLIDLEVTGNGAESVNLPSTGSDMSLLIVSLNGALPADNLEIVVQAASDDRLLGRGILNSIPFGLPIRGDDATTPSIDGALEGEQWQIILLRDDIPVPAYPRFSTGDNAFVVDALAVVELHCSNAVLPQEFVVKEIHPNPFNSSVVVHFGLPESSPVSLRVIDLNGRVVYRMNSTHYPAGWNAVKVIGNEWSSGIYWLELSSSFGKESRKLVLLK